MKQEMLIQYSRLVKFLGHTLGPDYEVVLHDFTEEGSTIVAIANGHISGRSVGDPPTNIALHLIAQKDYEKEDYHLNSGAFTSYNKRLRSSTMYIKDESGKLVGLLSVNFDDSRYRDVVDRVFKLCHSDNFRASSFKYSEELGAIVDKPADRANEATLGLTVTEVVQGNIAEILGEYEAPVDRLTPKEKMEIIEKLNGKGVFLMKGAVNCVADELQSSQVSIYRYLKRLSGENKIPKKDSDSE